REQRNEAAIATGLGVLRALGIASPRELEEETPSTTLHFAGDRELTDPLWEKLRRIASEASREIAQALEASPSPSVDGHSDPASTFRAAAIAAEGELSAAALIPLTEQELGEALTVTAAIALDPEHVHGDGRLLNAMSSAIRRRLRRQIRRILANESLERIAAVDFGWRPADGARGADLRGIGSPRPRSARGRRPHAVRRGLPARAIADAAHRAHLAREPQVRHAA
ncbi:MAG: hypothetical protein JRG80_23380, partial [Deltaproteobacteria bacterium]|nr:hypothetical protein [Deltaproteobacteria bacterium]